MSAYTHNRRNSRNGQNNNVSRLAESLQLERPSRHMVIASILIVALFAFEIFNFDTTRYALSSLIGEKSFVGVTWAAVLAIAFCAIDFAGLTRIFAPEAASDQSKESWYLMGAWFLGATMNAVMTWWAVSLVLINHPTLGNEVLTRATLVQYVPIFVALLVWLTRVLFIGSLAMAGEKLMAAHRHNQAVQQSASTRNQTHSNRVQNRPQQAEQRLSQSDQSPQYDWINEIQPNEPLVQAPKTQQTQLAQKPQRMQAKQRSGVSTNPSTQTVQSNPKPKPQPKRKANNRPNLNRPPQGLKASPRSRS